MTHKKLLAQGGTVHYWINKKKKDADCIVFTHGLTADHTMFAKQAAYFSKKYTTIFWDVPMHGLSRPYKNFSYHDTARDFAIGSLCGCGCGVSLVGIVV